MTLIAHLSDVHMLAEHDVRRPSLDRLRLRLLGVGRRVDPSDRRARLLHALGAAQRARADHVVVTGDLTEDGDEAQFAALAEALQASGWPPHRVTLVPGNHDGYTRADAWSKALTGSLSPWAPTSEPGSVTVLPGCVVLAVSTMIPQSFTRSAGRVGASQLARVEEVVGRTTDRAVAIALHHAPISRGDLVRDWIEGLLDRVPVAEKLRAWAHAHVLAGHTHKRGDVSLDGARARVFVAPAVVDHPAPLRLYRAARGRLDPIDAQLPVVDALRALRLDLGEGCAAEV